MNETKPWGLPDGVGRWLAPILRASRRKAVVFLACLAATGLALLLMTRTAPPAAAPPMGPAGAVPPSSAARGDAERLAENLAAILGQVAEAGRVEVRLTITAAAASQWEHNRRINHRTVEERAQDGGVQVTTEETEDTTLALARRPDGSESPIERASIPPQIAGAIIVADGARSPRVKAELTRAAAAFLGISLHRVMVFPREVTQ